MNYFKCFFYLLCCTLYSTGIPGQDYSYTHYTTRDGLVGELLYSIIQDSEGFMWFATETGMSRFDGQTFKSFKAGEGLSFNDVFGFHEDRKKRLWIRSFSNEICFYANGKIHDRKNDTNVAALMLSARIHAIIESKKGDIILMDELGNVVVWESSGKIRRYGYHEYRIDTDSILFGTGFHPDMINLPSEVRAQIKYFKEQKHADFSNTAFVRGSLFIQLRSRDIKGDIWLRYNSDKKTEVFIRPERIQAWIMDEDNMMESYTTGGAAFFNMSTKQRSALYLPSFKINGTYQDRDKNIWFATKRNGLYKLSNKKVVSLTFNNKNTGVAVVFIHVHGGKIFVGTDDGLFWQLSDIKKTDKKELPVYQRKKCDVTPAWLKDNADKYVINYKSVDFLHMGDSGGMVKTLYSYGDTLLLAMITGAYLSIGGRLSEAKKIHDDRTTCAIKHNGYYYIGTLGGLYVYDHNFNCFGTPVKNQISGLVAGEAGTLWISTYDHGVFAVNGTTVTGSVNKKNNFITSDLCRCIFYKDHNLWIGTDKGINKISLSGNSGKISSVYTAASGLNADIINTIFVDSGKVYAGTFAGLNIFNDQSGPADTVVDLHFTGISVSDTATDLDQPLLLPHNYNNVKFEFSGISYASDRISYRYRLSGLNEQWQETSEQAVNFLSLPSGKYRLQVQAFNPSGYSSAIIEKSFEVKQTVPEYWWVRLLTGLLVLVVLFFVVYRMIKNIKKKELEKRNIAGRIIELEQMALRAQMNPHFIFNCLNSVQHYILKQDAVGANFYLSQFAGLVRLTLEHSSKLLITLQEEITYLKYYIELERLQVNFPFEFKINPDADISMYDILTPNMIIQPFIENAIKHGLGDQEKGNSLTIDIKRTADMLVWTITDNGPGITATKRNKGKSLHQSKGITLIEKRIEMINMLRPDIPAIRFSIHDLETRGQQGTEVTVFIPVILNVTTGNQ